MTETKSLSTAAAATEDGGAAIIARAEEKAAVVAALPDEPGESALNKVNTDLEAMGIASGYDPEKKAIVQVASANIEIADPAKDPTFMLKREQIGNFALLQAKADIIRAIYTEFSAMDRALMNLDEEMDENRAKFQKAREAVEAKRAELAEALAQYDVVDAKTVSEAALKEKAKTLYAEYKALEATAKKFPQEPTLATDSVATMLSKMPLLGATVLTQAESWDPGDKQYCVAVAVVWSPKLQACAAKIGTGDFTATGKPGKFSKLDWVKAQDWRSMIGTRRFTDNTGHNYFIGIGAVDPGVGVQANAKRMLAETLARKNVAMALIGDLVTQREVKQNLKVYADQSLETKQKIVDAISSKVDLHLKGCMSLVKKEVRHPITGRKIYVSAYYIDPSMAKEAGDMMKKMFADAGLVAQHTNKQRGVVTGAAGAYEAAKSNAASRKAGVAEGASAVNARIAAERRAAEEKAARAKAQERAATAEKARAEQAAKREAENKAAAEKRKAEEAASAVSRGGTYSGGTIDTNF